MNNIEVIINFTLKIFKLTLQTDNKFAMKFTNQRDKLVMNVVDVTSTTNKQVFMSMFLW